MNALRDAIKSGDYSFYILKSINFAKTFFSYVGYISTIKSLINAGMSINLRFDDGQTPIHMAAELGNELRFIQNHS